MCLKRPVSICESNIRNAKRGLWFSKATRRRCAGVVCAAHLASAEFGAYALDGLAFASIGEVMQLMGTREQLAQTLGAEALSCAASSAQGRQLLEPLVAAGTLETLMEDGASTDVR